MLARGVFELAVDIRMLEATSNGWIKMVAFDEVDEIDSGLRVATHSESQNNRALATL
jgi:hypothetical protein